MKTTIKSIAEKAGVSFQVVSAVLNHRGNSRVSPQKRTLIEKIAAETGYIPNLNARILAGARSRLIGVLIDTQAGANAQQLLAEIERELNQRNYRTVVAEAHDNIDNLFDNCRILRQHSVEGIIVISHDYPGENQKIASFFAGSRDTVFIGEPLIPGCRHVLSTLDNGIQQAVRMLEKAGYRHIALIAPHQTAHTSIIRRIEGFETVPTAAVKTVYRCVVSETDPQTLKDELETVTRDRLIPDTVDAVITINDFCALALLGILQRHQLRVPEDMALIGCDNQLFTAHTMPTLSSIDLNAAALARAAVAALTDSGDDELIRKVDCSLILRQSFPGTPHHFSSSKISPQS